MKKSKAFGSSSKLDEQDVVLSVVPLHMVVFVYV